MSGTLDAATLEHTLAAWRADIDQALTAMVADLPPEDPVSGALRYALGAGGKRLRPVLCLGAMSATGAAEASWDVRVLAAASLELIHTYSLVHDDLPCMDDDDLRRGRPTAHRVFGARAAMLAGFALVPLACRVLDDAAARLGATDRTRRQIVLELCTGAGPAGMVGGQVLDLEAEGATLDRRSLSLIHAMKTGALFRAALRIGAVLADAPVRSIDALGVFGERLGLAFQITDDVLDVTMDASALGKTPGKDRDSSKTTFASLLGVSGARAAAAAEARAAIATLTENGIDSPLLEGLARFAVHRDR